MDGKGFPTALFGEKRSTSPKSKKVLTEPPKSLEKKAQTHRKAREIAKKKQGFRAACLQNETAPEKFKNRYEKRFEQREKGSEKRSETRLKTF